MGLSRTGAMIGGEKRCAIMEKKKGEERFVTMLNKLGLKWALDLLCYYLVGKSSTVETDS